MSGSGAGVPDPVGLRKNSLAVSRRRWRRFGRRGSSGGSKCDYLRLSRETDFGDGPVGIIPDGVFGGLRPVFLYCAGNFRDDLVALIKRGFVSVNHNGVISGSESCIADLKLVLNVNGFLHWGRPSWD